MIRKVFLLLCVLLSIFLLGCSIDNNEYGSVAFVLPSDSSRAADDTSAFTYQITLYPSDNSTIEIKAKGGEAIVKENIRIGVCEIEVQAFCDEAVVPMYEGSSKIFINASQINKAEITLSRIDYSKTTPVGINIKMEGDGYYCSNIHTNLSDLRIQRVFADGSKDKEFISPTKYYEIKFDEAPETTHSVGLYPVTLSNSTSGFSKTVMLPVYYSVFKGIAKTETKLELEVSEYKQNSTTSDSDFSVSIDSFTLDYRSRNGTKSTIEVNPKLESPKWYNNQEDEPIEGLEYKFRPKEIGEYKIHFEATVSAPDDEASGCVVNDWLVDVDGKSAETVKDIKRIKGNETDIGTGSNQNFEINIPETKDHFWMNYDEYCDTGNVLQGFYIYVGWDFEYDDNSVYTYQWKIAGVDAKTLADGKKVKVYSNVSDFITEMGEKTGHYTDAQSGIYVSTEALTAGAQLIECFITDPDKYVELEYMDIYVE